MSRRDVLDLLRRLSFAHTLVGDSRKGSAYNAAIWPLSRFEGELVEAVQDGSLSRVRGVGGGVVEIVRMVEAGQEPPELAELEALIPEGLFALGRIRGLGAKGVKRVWQELGVSSLADMEYACRENRLLALSGFGEKKQAQILAGVRRALAEQGLFRRDQALEAVVGRLPGAQVVGDLRRGCELVDQVELVWVGEPDRAAGILGLDAQDGQASGVIDDVPVRVWCVDADEWGTALLRHSGSAEHLAELGRLPVRETEEAVYEALGYHWTPPERREAGIPLVRLGEHRPRLLRLDDLRGALHNHTTASDGKDSLQAMQAAAAARGLQYLGISEHSQTAVYARGLPPDSLRAQAEQIRAMEGDCVLLAGVESDILQDGELDYDSELLAELDFVVASVHQRYRQDREAMTARMVRAARDPSVDLIGHPTGRLLLGRPPAPVDVAELIAACADSGCAIELNSSPQRLDLKVEHLGMARDAGVPISIGADAHSVDALANLEHGVALARRAGLRPAEVLNTRSLDELRGWLKERRDAVA